MVDRKTIEREVKVLVAQGKIRPNEAEDQIDAAVELFEKHILHTHVCVRNYRRRRRNKHIADILEFNISRDLVTKSED